MAKVELVMIAGWLFAAQMNAQSASFPILTVCEALDKAAEYDKKVVIVVGASRGTSEGSWIVEDCPGELVIDGRKWSHAISTTYYGDSTTLSGELVKGDDPPPPVPKGFRWNKKTLREKLTDVKKTTTLQVLPQYHYSDRWAAVYGRLEAKTTRVEIRGGLPMTYIGYGHLNGAAAQLVWPKNGSRRLP